MVLFCVRCPGRIVPWPAGNWKRPRRSPGLSTIAGRRPVPELCWVWPELWSLGCPPDYHPSQALQRARGNDAKLTGARAKIWILSVIPRPARMGRSARQALRACWRRLLRGRTPGAQVGGGFQWYVETVPGEHIDLEKEQHPVGSSVGSPVEQCFIATTRTAGIERLSFSYKRPGSPPRARRPRSLS